MRRFLQLAVSSAAVLLLGGCATVEAGSPQPADQQSTTGGSGGADQPGPTVRDPLQTGQYENDPCEVLSIEQLADIGLAGSESERRDRPIGAVCSWSVLDSGRDAGVSWLAANKNGISDIYRQKPQLAYFEPVEVQGYPGVFNAPTDARSTIGQCGISVGVTDQLAFTADFVAGRDDSKSQSCDRAEQIASAVIDTLKKGGN